MRLVGDAHAPAQRRAIYEAFKAHYDAFAALLPPEFVMTGDDPRNDSPLTR